MTTLQNTSITNIKKKTSLNGVYAELLVTAMNCGYNFIEAYKIAKSVYNYDNKK